MMSSAQSESASRIPIPGDLPEQLVTLLGQFVSPISARAMVRNALAKAERAGDSSVAAILVQLESTTKILIPQEQRGRALAAIRAELGSQTASANHPDEHAEQDDEHEYTVVDIRSERDVSPCRNLAREACKIVGVIGYTAQTVVTAVSELARNIACYAGEGQVRFRIDVDAQLIRVIAEDHGPGIANLEEVLSGNYRSRTGLGRGLLGVRRLAAEFDIQTSEQGTRVVVAFSYGGRIK